jgi:hypothetical protein
VEGEETTRDKGRKNEESVEGEWRKGKEMKRWKGKETTRNKRK